MRILRDVVRVAGPDATSFLQGQLSQDLGTIASGAAAWSLILQPQGKVDAWVRVTRAGDDEYLLDVDAGFGEAVVTRLDRFKLRVKADLELVGTIAIEIDEAADPASPLGAFGPVVVTGGTVWDEGGANAAWDALRVRLGIPAMGRELTADTIPEEAGVVDVSVSFTKGCYTGQELVARVDSRGRNVPRRLRRLTVDAGGVLSEGEEIIVEGKVVGTVTTSAGNEALGYVGRAIEPPATATVGSQVARIDALPPLR